jgi:hypothetical protein
VNKLNIFNLRNKKYISVCKCKTYFFFLFHSIFLRKKYFCIVMIHFQIQNKCNWEQLFVIQLLLTEASVFSRSWKTAKTETTKLFLFSESSFAFVRSIKIVVNIQYFA